MLTSLYLNFCVPLFWIGHGITNEHKVEHKPCLSVSTLSGSVYLFEKPSPPISLERTVHRREVGEVWAETYSVAAPGGHPGTIMRA
jgi:hypothetical protein